MAHGPEIKFEVEQGRSVTKVTRVDSGASLEFVQVGQSLSIQTLTEDIDPVAMCYQII